MSRTLVVNADDFGFTRDVNRGIVEAHTGGILTSTTLMATGAAFDDAVRLAREHPTLDIGCHLVLVGEPPFPPDIPKLVQAVALGRIPIHEKLSGQVRRILDSGIRPSHLDTHKHTHLLPAVLNVVARLSEEFGIPWVRRPFDLPILGARARRVLRKHGCRVADHFAGFRMTGKFGPAELAALIRELPEGITEFMCHPGVLGEELAGARTRLKESRQRELEALTSAEVRSALIERGVRLCGYADLV